MAVAQTEVELIDLDPTDIRADGATQSRENIYQPAVEEYAERMAVGDRFPPVRVYFDGETYWLADGFHRVRAAIFARLKSIACEVCKGGADDALLYGFAANASHGIRRTNADKRRAVRKMLMHAKWASWSDRRIAEFLHVSPPFVGAMRNESVNPAAHSPIRIGKRNGVETSIRTENIGTACQGAKSSVVYAPIKIATPVVQKQTHGSEFNEFMRRLRRQNLSPVAHVNGDLGIPCVTTEKRIYVVLGRLAPILFKLAFADVLMARQAINPKLKPFIVAHRSDDIAGLISVAVECGVGFIEIGSERS